MIVVIAVAIVGGWILASYFRRQYLRKKEKEFEMRPPVAWGPHQMQAMTGGFDSSDAALSASAAPAAKEGRTVIGTAVTSPESEIRDSRGWLLTKERP
jgi:hypothetical protein